MANKVTIDVEARFVDNVTSGLEAAAKSAEKLNKETDKINKKTVKPKISADDNDFETKMNKAEKRSAKFGKSKTEVTLGAKDKATSKIGQVTGAARAFASKSFKASLSMADKASHVLGSVTGAARSFAGKTFSAAVKIIDYATTPLQKIKDSLFSIKTLIATITAGMATKQFVLNPINLADSYSSAQIGFSTLLGEERGQSMMDDIDEFAKATPFKTSNVISNVQKMMAYGWDAEKVISDMETIGDAAAATGKGDQGLESIVYALSEIRSKGKLSTQELNQLASAGIKAKQYLAEGLGYGTDDAGLMKLAEDLEDGAIGANQAVELILQGMEEFDGMMDKTANETVEGLWSQIEDTFEINIFRRWGQGLQDGAKKGIGAVVDLLDSGEEALEDFGDLVYDIGKEISNWGADKLEDFVARVKEITQSKEFKNASLGGKIKLLFEGTILDPLKKWWNSDDVQSWIEEKKEWLGEKAAGWGESLGKGLSNGLLTLLGVDVTDAVGEGVDIGSSFAKGFAEGFDGSAVTDALVQAIKDVWGMLPTWAQFLIGGYVGGKAISGLASGYLNIVGAVSNIASGAKTIMGTPGNAMVQGVGLSNTLANVGYKLTGGAATAGGYFGAAGMSGAKAALIGGGAVAGGIAAGATTIKGGYDLYKSYKAYKDGDTTEAKARAASGGTALGGVATGAAIGSIFGPVGTLVGAGIGGIAGWVAGNKWADSIRHANVESEELKSTLEDSEASAEELAAAMEKAAQTKLAERFGDIELSMEEINTLAKNIVFDGHAKTMEQFANASQKAEQSLQSFKTAAADMDRLEFDMSERAWKIEMGLEEKLSEDEIEQVKARVQSYIESAEQLLSDEHYKFNAAVEVIMTPSEMEDNSEYDQLISDGNSMYAKLQEQLDGLTEDLTAKYNLYLEDGEISVDEQGTLSRIQGKIAEIMEKVSNAETEASFEVSKLKFTTGDLSAESFEQFQASLQTQLSNFQAEQEEALTVAISEINLELEEGTITQEQYDNKLKTLVDNYNTNIDNMTARVSNVQLEGISDAFDGVATAEQIQSAINGVLADGENPLDLTFDDINAHLNLKEDALSEDDKLAFVEVMQTAIQSAASGENALKTTAEVDPTITVSEDANINEELKNHLESKLAEEEGPTITPSLNVSPELAFEDGAAESLNTECKSLVASYLTGDNAINTTADVYAAAKMYGAEGIPLAEEADKGCTNVQSYVDAAFTDPLSASADANVTLNWKITNPSPTLSISGGGGNGSTITASVAQNASGGFISGGPQLSWLDEEGTGEVVIPFNPSRRARALELYAETGRRLGIANHANGGFVGRDSSPAPTYDSEIPTGSGEQKIEVNMGGVTIEIKTDGSKPIAQSIEDQEQEIAERVAKIFKNVFAAQFANRPLKGGAS